MKGSSIAFDSICSAFVYVLCIYMHIVLRWRFGLMVT